MNQNTNNNIETTLESLFRRRSHRAFAQAPIDEQSITTIIQAGAAAPSAHGKKPFRFARIENKATIEAIVEKFPWFAPAGKAASNILVLGDPEQCARTEYWTVDCAAATENILLAVQALGLGAVWMGIAPVEENIVNFRSLMEIPANLVPFSLIAIGYPETPTTNERERPVAEDFIITL